MTITEYAKAVDDFAWYGIGDIFAIAKAAKKLGRNYMQDIADAKTALILSRR